MMSELMYEEPVPGEYGDPRHDRLIHSARHLTGAEMHRLLHRYDLRPMTARILAHHEAEEAWWAFEVYSEQMAERGRATRHRTRLERYLEAHPVHGPVTGPKPWVAPDDDDIPF